MNTEYRSSATKRREQVVVVGGGAGGAELVSALGRSRRGPAAPEVTLVDCAASHLWKPRLHEVAVGLIGMGEDETPYLALGRVNSFLFQWGSLTGLDPAAQTISISGVNGVDGAELIGPRQIAYDTLVLAFGSRVNDFGVEGVVENCCFLDSGDQARAFQRRFLEQALQVLGGVRSCLRIGIVGAGATGVELAAELHHAVRELERYGALGARSLEITLIDMAPRVLPNSDPSTSAFAERTLRRLGVQVRLNSGVERVTPEAFILEGGDQVRCDLKVWASGVVGREVARRLQGLQLDRAQRILCDGFLRCQGVSNIYALGDCAAVHDPESGMALPATAQVAHQQAAWLARALTTRRAGRAPKPFRHRPMGSLVSLGHAAAGEIPTRRRGPLTFNGLLPKALYEWLQLQHRAALVGWVNSVALSLADILRKTSAPPVKLH